MLQKLPKKRKHAARVTPASGEVQSIPVSPLPKKLGKGVKPSAPIQSPRAASLPDADPFPLIHIDFPTQKYEQGETIKPTPNHPAFGANDFMRRLAAMEDLKRERYALIAKHEELFGSPPEVGTSLQIVKARCMYRLQFLGYKQLSVVPPIKFQINYKAMMKFGAEPFEGCTRDVSEVSKLLMWEEREVSQMAVKQARKASGKTTPKAEGKRQKVLGDLSVVETIRYMAKVLHAGAAQIDAALKKLNVEAKISTIRAQSFRARKGLKGNPIPSLSAEQVSKLKSVIPSEEKLEAAIKAAPKAAKATPAKTKKPVKLLKKSAKAVAS